MKVMAADKAGGAEVFFQFLIPLTDIAQYNPKLL